MTNAERTMGYRGFHYRPLKKTSADKIRDLLANRCKGSYRPEGYIHKGFYEKAKLVDAEADVYEILGINGNYKVLTGSHMPEPGNWVIPCSRHLAIIMKY